MITIAGIKLPETAVWVNETEYGQPKTSVETDLAGIDRVFFGSVQNNIEIYIPATESGIRRTDVIKLCQAAAAHAPLYAEINGSRFSVIFAGGSRSLEIKPVTPKQTYSDTDPYSGTIRL